MNTKFLLSFLFLIVVTVVYADPFESTHLVTMRKAEMMEIVDCISKSLNPIMCDKFNDCEKLLPKQILIATDVCKKKCLKGEVKKCSHIEPLFESPEIPMKIFDCVVENTHKLNVEENKMMVEFEKCMRDLHDLTCKFPKHYEEIH